MRSIQYALTSLYHVPFTSFASIEKETSILSPTLGASSIGPSQL